MKTPRRSFVVEYKSSRRPAKARPTSIWGSLDLQAVSRAVEADGVLPFEDPRPDDISLHANAKIYAVPVASSSAVEIDDPVEAPASAMATGDRHVPDVDDTTPDSNSARATAVAAAKPPSPSEVKIRARPRRSRGNTHATQSGDPIVAEDNPGPEDELAALERENHRLKILVLAKIRTENAWLASRLLRFHPS